MAESGRPRPAEGVRGKDLGSEYMFYDDDGDHIHVLNATAREVFILCDGTRTPSDVIHDMVDRFEVDEATVRRDVTETIELLLNMNLLTVS